MHPTNYGKLLGWIVLAIGVIMIVSGLGVLWGQFNPKLTVWGGLIFGLGGSIALVQK